MSVRDVSSASQRSSMALCASGRGFGGAAGRAALPERMLFTGRATAAAFIEAEAEARGVEVAPAPERLEVFEPPRFIWRAKNRIKRGDMIT